MKRPLDPGAQEVLDALLDIIAANVQGLMDEQFDGKSNKPLALGKESGVGKATVQRILKGANKTAAKHPPPNIKTLIALSWRFNVSLQWLLTDQSKRARLLRPLDNEVDDEVPPRQLKRRRSR
jgi:hypothetical protein